MPVTKELIPLTQSVLRSIHASAINCFVFSGVQYNRQGGFLFITLAPPAGQNSLVIKDPMDDKSFNIYIDFNVLTLLSLFFIQPAKIALNNFFRAVQLLALLPYTYIGTVKDITKMCVAPIMPNTLRGPCFIYQFAMRKFRPKVSSFNRYIYIPNS